MRREKYALPFICPWATRSGAIATGSPSCNSQRPSWPSVQARNSLTVILLFAVAGMPDSNTKDDGNRIARRQPITGILKLAPSFTPEGQREVTVLVLV